MVRKTFCWRTKMGRSRKYIGIGEYSRHRKPWFRNFGNRHSGGGKLFDWLVYHLSGSAVLSSPEPLCGAVAGFTMPQYLIGFHPVNHWFCGFLLTGQHGHKRRNIQLLRRWFLLHFCYTYKWCAEKPLSIVFFEVQIHSSPISRMLDPWIFKGFIFILNILL